MRYRVYVPHHLVLHLHELQHVHKSLCADTVLLMSCFAYDIVPLPHYPSSSAALGARDGEADEGAGDTSDRLYSRGLSCIEHIIRLTQ